MKARGHERSKEKRNSDGSAKHNEVRCMYPRKICSQKKSSAISLLLNVHVMSQMQKANAGKCKAERNKFFFQENVHLHAISYLRYLHSYFLIYFF